jgi:thiamine biosynthesis lipoprotein
VHDDPVGHHNVQMSAVKFEIWGLTGTLATERDDQMPLAEQRLWHWLDAFDATCNRFRADSEISRLNARSGEVVAISETFELALDAALRAGHATSGLCDPTVLPALLALGYDRDYDELSRSGASAAGEPVAAAGLDAISLDREHHTVTLAPGCRIDLGASAKALVADIVAAELSPHGGIVVEIGGDVAVRGVGPQGPWVIGVSDTLATNGNEPRISLAQGGVATSSTATRAWRAGNQIVNHIVDPRTGSFAHSIYATATVSADSCVTANAFATAALLWGDDAGYRIAQAGWSGRLVGHDGSVEFVGGWPREEEGRA